MSESINETPVASTSDAENNYKYVWAYRDTKELIALWKKYFKSLKAVKRNASIYNKMAEELNKNLGKKEGDLKPTTTELRKRIENLKKQFR